MTRASLFSSLKGLAEMAAQDCPLEPEVSSQVRFVLAGGDAGTNLPRLIEASGAVVGGNADASKCTVRGLAAGASLKVGDAATFVLTTVGFDGEPCTESGGDDRVEAFLTVGHGDNRVVVDADVADNGDGTFTFTVTPPEHAAEGGGGGGGAAGAVAGAAAGQAAREAAVAVNVNGLGVVGSPFAVTVTTIPWDDSILLGESADPNGAKLLQFVAETIPTFPAATTALKLLFRASRDGWDADAGFHARCDGKGPTVTVVAIAGGSGKNQRKHHVFGGIVDLPWASQGDYKGSQHANLFGLGCHENEAPVLFGIKDRDTNAVYHGAGYGPIFGGGHDLKITSNAHQSTSSYQNCRVGGVPNYYFAGVRNFAVVDYEVFLIAAL